MGYADKDDTADAVLPERASYATVALGALVRLVGLAVLLVGLWVGVKIILEAWALYEDPSRIVRFADDIQRHSNLDGVIGTISSESADASQAGKSSQGGGFRLSYFAAWFIVLLLMFVIGSLAMTAIATGGQLTLYDLQVRQHSRAVIREVRRLRQAA